MPNFVDAISINGTEVIDTSGNITVGSNMKFADDELLYFGTGDDIGLKWDGTSFSIASTAAASPTLFGAAGKVLNITHHGTYTVGVDDTGYDVKFFGATSGKYMLWDESEDQLTLLGALDITGNSQLTGTLTVGVDDTGYDVQFFGATSGKYLLWDESDDKLIVLGDYDITGNSQFTGTITVGVDDTGHDVKFFGATSGKYWLWDESADSVVLNGVMQIGETTTTALAIGGGDSTTKLTTAEADKKFGEFYTESTATTGDSRGIYWRHYLGGTISSAGYGDCIRAFTTVTGTGYDYASGIHSTMQINTGATVTGSGAGLRATLSAESESRTLTGALASLQLDTDIGADNVLPARCSLIRLAKSGTVDVTNFLDIADDQCLLGSAAAGSATDALAVILPNGSIGYINIYAVS